MTMTMNKIKARAEALMPDYYRNYIRFSNEQLRWLGEAIDPTITDTKPMTAHRVYRSMDYQGQRLYKTEVKMPEGVDARQWATEYVAERGLCMELCNADGEIVFKTTPPIDTAMTFM